MKNRSALVLAMLPLVFACARSLAPLRGVPPVNASLPSYEIAAGHQRVTFRWEFQQGDVIARGDGIARLAAPDSARIDLFVAGGFGGGSAVLIGNELRSAPGPDIAALVPPPTLLWAAFGRLALPSLPDTTIRISDDTLRADVGQPVAWRVVAVGPQLVAAERVEGSRVAERVARVPGRSVRYESQRTRRTLLLTIARSEPSPAFDASIWTF